MSTSKNSTISCPYVGGATFRLEISAPNGMSGHLQASVTKTFSPFTISPVMKVRLNNIHPMEPGSLTVGIDIPAEVVFKVYDRRFCPSLRRWYKLAECTPESEAEYARYIPPQNLNSIKAIEHLLYGVRTPEEEEDDDEDDEVPEELVEHLVQLTMASYFEAECATYDRLSSLQGNDIPEFFGATRFVDGTSTQGVDLQSIRGVLLEFIPGINLEFVKPETVDIDKLISDCMRIYERYTDLDVLNQDVRFENFIVKPDGSGVVMIDLAQSRLRGEDEDFATWKKAKWGVDEEGAIGMVAHGKWGWNFQHSLKWVVPADEDD